MSQKWGGSVSCSLENSEKEQAFSPLHFKKNKNQNEAVFLLFSSFGKLNYFVFKFSAAKERGIPCAGGARR